MNVDTASRGAGVPCKSKIMKRENSRLVYPLLVLLYVSIVAGALAKPVASRRRLTAKEWSTLLVTGWSKTQVRESLVSRMAEAKSTTEGHTLSYFQHTLDRETQNESSSERWLYLIGTQPDSVLKVLELTGGGAHHLSAQGQEAVHWFLLFTTREFAEQLREEEGIEHVQAVPQTLKVEPFHLGVKLQALQSYSRKSDNECDIALERAELLKVVLAEGAFENLDAVKSTAEAWELALAGPAIAREQSLEFSCGHGAEPSCCDHPVSSCSAQDTDAIICGPIQPSQLASATEWLAAQPESLVVEIKRRFQLLNKWAKQVVQVCLLFSQ
jgi:hypothetical protein